MPHSQPQGWEEVETESSGDQHLATFRARQRQDGTIGYTAQIRMQVGGQPHHSEAKTFSRLSAAREWASRRELELENSKTPHHEKDPLPLGDLINWYIDEFEEGGNWGRTKAQHLRFLVRHPVAKLDAVQLTTQALIDHIRGRRREGAGPSTVEMDLVFIGVVLRAAKSARSVPVQPTIVEEARTACRELRLIAKSRKRERRPTPQELSLLDEHFKTRRGRIPMQDILWFAIHSARRQDEITRLEWGDNDPEALTGVVHDAKHPTQKEGNNRRFRYTQQGWDIVQRQPRNSQYIFPFKGRSIGASFTRACKILGIKNLRFHDLRHEATSRLFERGYQIHEVQQFTIHESWADLMRYTHLIPGNTRTL